MVESLISDIMFGFIGMISIINPFGGAFVFLDRTASLTLDERDALARKVAINAACVLLVAFFIGTPILHFFGISMEALRIGGGSRSPSAAGRCSMRPTRRPSRRT